MSKFKVEHRYIKPPIKSIIDKAEEVIPEGYFCTGNGAKCSSVGDTECPFLQWRKMTHSRLKKFKKVFTNPKTGETVTYYDIPAGNTMLQYCSYLKDYLYIQDCIKDCRIKDYWPNEADDIDEILYEATSDGLDKELRKKNDELIKRDVEEIIEKIKIKEKYNLLATKYANKKEEED